MWFQDHRFAGVAVICGAVSGNLEMLELEGRAVTQENLDKIRTECGRHGVLDEWDALLYGYSERTPSGGLHLLYRIRDHEVPPNRKIAMRPALDSELTDSERKGLEEGHALQLVRVLAETRGEGGYVIVAPTTGHCHSSGKPWTALQGTPGTIPTIGWAVRSLLHEAVGKALDEMPAPAPVVMPTQPVAKRTDGSLSPADDFNLRAQWTDPWFTGQGWTLSHRDGNELFWCRPGKERSEGHSATTGRADDADRLYIWSTSTTLEAETPHSKFYVYAHYHHGGDMQAAARALRAQGYGTSTIPPIQAFVASQPAPTSPSSGTVAPANSNQPIVIAGPDIHMDDTSVADYLHASFKDKFRYCSEEKRWYLWTGSAWQPDLLFEVHRAATHAAKMVRDAAATYHQQTQSRDSLRQYNNSKSCLNNRNIEAAIARFRAVPGMSVKAEMFDRETHLLNLQNGTYDLRSGQLRPASPDDLITMTFGASYDPEATCPGWTKFISQVLPDPELRSYVQTALGYTLLGRPVERAMFLVHGPSGTGKSVLTSVMTAVFGDYGTTAPASSFRLKHSDTSSDVHSLRGKRWVATSEMPDGAQLNDELVKRITGGDAIKSRNLYESWQEWHAQCVIWIATNYLPRTNGDDNAIWRRAKTIALRVEIGRPGQPVEIHGLSQFLIGEADGILNWLLEGLAQYQDHGLIEPACLKADVADYRADTDSVSGWLREALAEGEWELDPEAHVRSTMVYESYTRYCQEWGSTPLSRRRFAHRLKCLEQPIVPNKIGGNQVWVGLKSLESGNIRD